MPQIKANGINLEYESYGPASGPTILLIMGLGGQLTRWPLPFIEMLTARGYRVIRYDNRDVGLSKKFDEAGPVNVQNLMADVAAGKKLKVPYSMRDMAADGVGLLDALGIKKAHIVGASMGGMIAQWVAADFPEHTISLTSIMSSSGNPALPTSTPEATAILFNRLPADADLDTILDYGVKGAKVIGSPGYPQDDAVLRNQIASDYKRSNYPDGFSRQIAAVMADGDRRPVLKRITAPTVVVHGADDPLVRVDAGRDTAENISGAELRVVPGMGHDLPPGLYPTLVAAIEAAVSRSRARA
jgi:pimeloyl-ACP methyl ester carboxylesterase